MKKNNFFNSLVFKLILGIIIGIFVGRISNEGAIVAIDSVKRIIGDLIGYIVPLIILGFITPAIVSLKESAGKILSVTLVICYLSTVGAATMSFLAGKAIIPKLNIASNVGGGNAIPESIFKLSIDPIMPVMTALVTSILFGIAVIVTNSETWEKMLIELNKIVLSIVNNVVIKILPLYIATTSVSYTHL